MKQFVESVLARVQEAGQVAGLAVNTRESVVTTPARQSRLVAATLPNSNWGPVTNITSKLGPGQYSTLKMQVL